MAVGKEILNHLIECSVEFVFCCLVLRNEIHMKLNPYSGVGFCINEKHTHTLLLFMVQNRIQH